MLRRAVPMVFAGAPVDEAVGQVAPQLTPGATQYASSIDLDSPFAVVAVVTESTSEAASPVWLAAWPLKPGVGVTINAREGRGWEVQSEGVYRPSASAADGGATAEQQCWVARRQPVGWSLLCGPRELLPRVAGYLRHVGTIAPDNQAILDVDVRAGILGRYARRQLAEIDRQAPPRGTQGPEAIRRQAFDQLRRQAAFTTAIATDIDSVTGTLTQDETAMHLRLSATVGRASSDVARFLIDASAGRQASAALLQALPSATQAWIVSGFDRDKITSAMGASSPDVMVAAQAGPEFARVKMLLDEVTNVSPPGSRVDAYSPDGGHTMIRVVQRADAERFVDDFRVAVQSIPSRQIAPGQTLRDMAVVMPTTGITGHTLRIGQNLRPPPGARLTEEQRDQLNRSILLVAVGEQLTIVQGRDPVAQYRAWQSGTERLSATIPPQSVMSGRITMASFGPFFYGQPVGGLPEGVSEGLDFSVQVERRGEGATVSLRADAPLAVATGLRQLYAAIEAQRAQAMQQQMQAMQQQQQQQQAQMQAMQQAQRGAQRAPINPANLPEPEPIRLRPPQ